MTIRPLNALALALALLALLALAGPAALAQDSKESPSVLVRSAQLNLRAGPGTNHRKVTVLRRGAHMDIVGRSGGWLKVRAANGKQGWISAKYATEYDASPRATEKILAGEHATDLELAVRRFVVDAKRRGQMYKQDNLYLIVEDLKTGQRLVSLNADTQVKAASLIKVPILQAYQIQRYRGEIQHTKENQRQLQLMIHRSSNHATNRILRLLGGPRETARILGETGLYRQMRLVEYIPEGGRTYLNKTSAEDLNRLFKKIWAKEALGAGFNRRANEKASDEMLHLLGIQGAGVRDRLRDGTCIARESGTRIWDKTGFVRGLNGNVGIMEVATPSGPRAYSIMSIIERADYQSIPGSGNGWASRQSRLHRRLSEMAYAHFKSANGARTQCGASQLANFGRGSDSAGAVADNNQG